MEPTVDILSSNLSPDKVKYYRKNNGWSQDVLAKAAGLSLRTIQRVEKDGTSSAETQLSLSAALNLSPKDLFPVSTTLDVQWKRKILMQNIIAVLIVFGALFLLFALAGGITMFADIHTAIFLSLFTCAATVISFGSVGLIKSILGLKYIFASDISASPTTRYLAHILSKQIWFIYGGALIGGLIGLISIYSNIGNINSDAELYAAFAVNALIFLYAAIIAECIIRPLSIKLLHTDEMAKLVENRQEK